jgi:hypothetical protein
MEFLNYSNLAPPLSLSAGINAAATTATVSSTAGYPDAPFLLGFERGTPNEEVCRCTAKTGTEFTIERGYDGTTAKSHGVGTMVEHTVSGLVFRGSGIVRVTTAIRTALAGENLWEGRVVWDTDLKALHYYNGTSWERGMADDLVTFGKEGTLSVQTGKGRFYLPFSATLLGVRAAVNTVPTGASIIVDLLRNGTTVFPTNPGDRPTIAAGTNASDEEVPDTTTLNAGDYLTSNIAQVGSTIAGADLTVVVRYRRS